MLESIIRTADENRIVCEDDYIGEDGLLHCAKCGGKKQTVITFAGERRTVNCICKCIEKRMKQQELEQKARQLRKECFSSSRFESCTFQADKEPYSEASVIARNYADSFDTGSSGWLVLCGDTGTGKSFRAACICNSVAEKGFPARFTTFSGIERSLWNERDKQSVYSRLDRTALLVLDDFGCERKSDYMNEIRYSVICDRYDRGLPLVITTNLTPSDFKSADIADKRIYSRIFERGVFVSVMGEDKRKLHMKANMKAEKQKLSDAEAMMQQTGTGAVLNG